MSSRTDNEEVQAATPPLILRSPTPEERANLGLSRRGYNLASLLHQVPARQGPSEPPIDRTVLPHYLRARMASSRRLSNMMTDRPPRRQVADIVAPLLSNGGGGNIGNGGGGGGDPPPAELIFGKP